LNGVDLLYGGSGDDTLFGQNGVDTMYGGAGNDVLYGGTGNDVLEGGSDSDTFVFNSNLTSNVDTINDFVSGTDKIYLENTGGGLFNALAAGSLSAAAFDIVGDGTAATASTRIIYDASTGALFYDADGAGSGSASVQFALIGVGTALAFTDFTVI
jgi:serralysin